MKNDNKLRKLLTELQQDVNWVLEQPNFDASTDRTVEKIAAEGITLNLLTGNLGENLNSLTYIELGDQEYYEGEEDFTYGIFIVEEKLAPSLEKFINDKHLAWIDDDIGDFDEYAGEFNFIKSCVESDERFKNIIYLDRLTKIKI